MNVLKGMLCFVSLRVDDSAASRNWNDLSRFSTLGCLTQIKN